uniref:Uncharacterized protein n=1 Tax=viral metagenome TaxID=1070528 RepID=A0A6C0FCL3_9ZZZZ|tara:strand:- start:9395 stop:10009 length:615 start_codon:yes stop_codon:yes gene_type:complete
MSENTVDNNTMGGPSLQPQKLFTMVKNGVFLAGFLILFLTLGGGGENQTWGMIIGYSFVLTGAILFTSNIVSKLVRSKNSESKSILSLFVTLGPFFVFTVLVACIVALLASYFQRIAKKQLTPAFEQLTTLSLLNTLLLTYLFNRNTSTEEFKKTQEVNKVSGMIMYLVEILGFIIVISMFIVLKFYVTDGFSNSFHSSYFNSD